MSMGQRTILGNFQLPLNYNRLIIYVATFTTYALNFLCPYTLGKKHYIKICDWCCFLVIFFGRVRYLLEEVLFLNLRKAQLF
jgi:hypothetical protein